MADNQNVIVLTRATYDNRQREGQISADTIYVIQEDTTSSGKFMTMNFGEAQITDLINLNKLVTLPANLTPADYENINIPITFAIKNKLYVLEDDVRNIARAYVCKDDLTTIPLYGTCMWEDLT